MELKYIAKKEDIGLTINQILQSKLKISSRLRQQIINENKEKYWKRLIIKLICL